MKIKIIAFYFLFLNVCYCADGERTFESKEGPTLHRVHQQEEERLKGRPQAFWAAFTPHMDRIRQWGETQRAKRAKDPQVETTILTRRCRDLYRPVDFEAWLAVRFPKDKCNLWMAKEDGHVLFPRNDTGVQRRFNEDMARLADEMMEKCRRITSAFGRNGVGARRCGGPRLSP